MRESEGREERENERRNEKERETKKRLSRDLIDEYFKAPRRNVISRQSF